MAGVLRFPSDRESTVIQCRDNRSALAISGVGVDLKFTADGLAIRIVELGPDLERAGRRAVVAFPGHDIAATREACHRGRELKGVCGGIHQCLGSEPFIQIGADGHRHRAGRGPRSAIGNLVGKAVFTDEILWRGIGDRPVRVDLRGAPLDAAGGGRHRQCVAVNVGIVVQNRNGDRRILVGPADVGRGRGIVVHCIDVQRHRGLVGAAIAVIDRVGEAVAAREVGIRRVVEAAVRVQGQGAVADVRDQRDGERITIDIAVRSVAVIGQNALAGQRAILGEREAVILRHGGVVQIHCGKNPRLDSGPAAVLGSVAGVPGHHKASIWQCGDRGGILMKHRLGIDQEFAALGGAGGIERLRLDGIPVSVLGCVPRGPCHHEAAVCQRGDRGLILIIPCLGIDQEFAALGGAGSIENLRLDGRLATVLSRVLRIPRHHETAARQGGNGGHGLVAHGFGIDQEFSSLGSAGGVEHLRLDGIPAAVLGSVRGPPCHHETAV